MVIRGGYYKCYTFYSLEVCRVMPIENVIRILVFIKRNIKSKPVIEYINDSIRELKQFQEELKQ
jgi:hypothetical protein